MQAANPISLKVLMTTDTVGGVWTYCMELCQALAPHGVQFYLHTAGAPLHQTQWAEVKKIDNVQVFETSYKLEWMQDAWADIEKSGQELLELERELKPDVVHLNSFSYGALPFAAPKIVVAHSDVFSWWQAVHGTGPTDNWQTYYTHVKAGLDSATIVVAPSAAMLQEIESIYAPAAPTKVVYNFRDGHAFTAGPKKPEVMAMGRIWDEAKNVQLLLQAAPHIGYPVKLAGASEYEDNTIATEGEKVVYLGKLSAEGVARELATASVFVLPARYEPFGLSALEAALSGCALVLGNIPSLREIWQDAAIYVEKDDATSLAVIINKLLCDGAMCADLAQKAYNRAQQFSAAKGATAYRLLYQHLVQQRIEF